MSLEVRIEKKLGNFILKTDFVTDGEPTALLGASGCGKSLTLRCIAGIVRPDKGRIVLNGRVLYDSEEKIDLPPQKRKVGYLFQNYALFDNMTVEQNISCGISSEKNRAERKKQVAAMIERMQLTGLEKNKPHQLSGGQQQRVAITAISLSMILLTFVMTAVGSFRLDSYLESRIVGDFLLGSNGIFSVTSISDDYEISEDYIDMADGAAWHGLQKKSIVERLRENE